MTSDYPKYVQGKFIQILTIVNIIYVRGSQHVWLYNCQFAFVKNLLYGLS